jgi:hypothetical protein
VAFCIEVQLVRTGKATSGAKRFLAFITEERYLTLAMLADAFDEAMLLVRLFEQGDYDAAGILSTIQTYVDNLDVLFLQKKSQVLWVHKVCSGIAENTACFFGWSRTQDLWWPACDH